MLFHRRTLGTSMIGNPRRKQQPAQTQQSHPAMPTCTCCRSRHRTSPLRYARQAAATMASNLHTTSLLGDTCGDGQEWKLKLACHDNVHVWPCESPQLAASCRFGPARRHKRSNTRASPRHTEPTFARTPKMQTDPKLNPTTCARLIYLRLQQM